MRINLPSKDLNHLAYWERVEAMDSALSTRTKTRPPEEDNEKENGAKERRKNKKSEGSNIARKKEETPVETDRGESRADLNLMESIIYDYNIPFSFHLILVFLVYFLYHSFIFIVKIKL